MSADMAVEASEVTKSFGDQHVLRGLSLAVPRGTVFSLLGPNGAGKTTTVRILATLARPDSGTVRVAGLDALASRRQVRRRISLTGQYAAVDAAQTGAENLRMAGRLAGLSRAAARIRTDELLMQFGLTDAAGRRSGTYSGGMRRRLDLAAGLVSRPEVMFLDEPTTGLDLPGRQAVWQVITELAGSGSSAVVLVPVGFISDHMEVVFDLDVEAARHAERLGLPLARAATPSTDPRFVAMITELVSERQDGLSPRALGELGPTLRVCGSGCCGAGTARPGVSA